MDYLDYIFLIGRVLFGGFFLVSGIDHFRNSQGLIQYAKAKGVPAAKFSVIFSGIVLIAGGVGIILGVYPMYSAILVGLFVLIAAFKVHTFWKVTDPAARANDRIGFSKNIALLGAALVFMAFPTPWPLSIHSSSSDGLSDDNSFMVGETGEMNDRNDLSSSSLDTSGSNTQTATITNSQTSSILGAGESFGVPSVASLSVFNQKAAAAAHVSLVSTDSSSWLAVREDKNGLMSNILGAKRIDMGTTANVDIPLQRSTEVGKIYHVVLFQDNGDKVFDFKVDPPMTESGMLISKSFLAL